MSFINSNEIIKRLHNKNVNIHTFDVVTSTNDIAKAEAISGCAEFNVYIANQQTNGRGRGNHSFHSPKQTGLYMSIVLRPVIDMAYCTYITTAAAVAVAEAIKVVSGYDANIKWINDIYCHNRKVCGILTESALTENNEQIQYAVLGIGVNVYNPMQGFPNEIVNTAGVIFDTVNDENTINRLAAEIINRFENYYLNLSKKPHLEKYRELCSIIGTECDAVIGDNECKVKVLSVDNDFHLEVLLPSGEIRKLSSGELHIKI